MPRRLRFVYYDYVLATDVCRDDQAAGLTDPLARAIREDHGVDVPPTLHAAARGDDLELLEQHPT